MPPSTWTPADLPDLTGRRVLVTGVTSGIGIGTARELGRAGAEVILAARNHAKLARTRAALVAEVPHATFRDLVIDVSEMASIRRAAEEAQRFGPLHCLINNAGVMAVPYARTGDGFELQFATNHLGPFLLTGLLLPQLVESGDGRVVAVASQAHRFARKPPLGDPRKKKGRYSRWRTYAQTKLADLMFTYELDRRLRAAGLPVKALAAHPGYSATELMGAGRGDSLRGQAMQGVFGALGQPAEMGAWPSLMAATADLPGSTYVGPDSPGEFAGSPRIVASTLRSRDRELQAQLWELSEEATGIRYP